ncbi:MAG: 50S ribosomal protein L18 [Candidatus Odinarchaeota archaeon]|nr:50S ribosomal protein L18 [Candidatus Odinarchaeota archaeon]
MARGPRYKVPFRRRREGKTNYYKRRRLLLSGKPRLIIRKTLKRIIAQIAIAKLEGDYILVSADSYELKKYGWLGSTSNTPAAYLVGLLIAKKALNKGITEVVPDIGLNTPSPGARVFAALKGAKDGGLKFNLGEKVIPDESRIKGEHIARYAEILEKENPQRFKLQFSEYLKRNFHPKDLPKHFDQIRQKILEESGG